MRWGKIAVGLGRLIILIGSAGFLLCIICLPMLVPLIKQLMGKDLTTYLSSHNGGAAPTFPLQPSAMRRIVWTSHPNAGRQVAVLRTVVALGYGMIIPQLIPQ